MPNMVDFYRSRYGELVKGAENAACLNGPCPYCNGGTDRFMIWPHKREALGKTCAEHNITGIFWCRQCGKGGDTIEYLMTAEGLEFHDACAELGIERRKDERRERHVPREKAPVPTFEGRELENPKALWLAHVARMDEAARAALPNRPSALAWLARRGITRRMAERYGLGVVDGENGHDCRFRSRASFGLPERLGANGRPKKLCIRRGISIPSRIGGEIVMFRVRRPNADVQEKQGKYWELDGGSKCSYHLPPTTAGQVKIYMVLEGEFDAMLVHAIAGETIGAVALRNATNRPDADTHAALAGADQILLALDSDKAGANGSGWWLTNYPQTRLCFIPGFKDPGEAYMAGFDLRLWLEAMMPRSVRLAPSTQPELEPAAPEKSVEVLPGTGEVGARGAAQSPSPAAPSGGGIPADVDDAYADLLTEDNLRGLREALPPYLDMEAVPREVLALAVLWNGAPARYVKKGGGFDWRVKPAWGRQCPDWYRRFMDLATSSPAVWDWLGAHVDDEITSRNFLQLLGDC